MFKFLRRKPKIEPKSEGFLSYIAVEDLRKTPKNIVPETEEFIKELCRILRPTEKVELEIETEKGRVVLEEMFMNKYGCRMMKFNKEISLTIAGVLAQRNWCLLRDNMLLYYGTDEILERFEELFEVEQIFSKEKRKNALN